MSSHHKTKKMHLYLEDETNASSSSSTFYNFYPATKRLSLKKWKDHEQGSRKTWSSRDPGDNDFNSSSSISMPTTDQQCVNLVLPEPCTWIDSSQGFGHQPTNRCQGQATSGPSQSWVTDQVPAMCLATQVPPYSNLKLPPPPSTTSLSVEGHLPSYWYLVLWTLL